MSIPYKHRVINVLLTFGKIYGSYYPHFIVYYNNKTAKIAIDRTLFEGVLPAEVANFLLDWAEKNYLELEAKWNEMMDREISYKKVA